MNFFKVIFQCELLDQFFLYKLFDSDALCKEQFEISPMQLTLTAYKLLWCNTSCLYTETVTQECGFAV
jgi:hypothetical protein